MSNYKLFTKHDQEIRKIVNKMDSVLYYDRVCEELFSDKITLGIIVVWHKLSIIMKEQILTNDDEKNLVYTKWFIFLYNKYFEHRKKLKHTESTVVISSIKKYIIIICIVIFCLK